MCSMNTDESLAEVRQTSAAREAAKEQLHKAIRDAVKAGYTFAAVARAAGITRNRVEQIVRPDKAYARAIAMKAKASGELVPQPCESCGSTERIAMHHDDYSQPLNVRWLCDPCHRRVHVKLRAGAGYGVPDVRYLTR